MATENPAKCLLSKDILFSLSFVQDDKKNTKPRKPILGGQSGYRLPNMDERSPNSWFCYV